jgi:hypothetical protein
MKRSWLIFPTLVILGSAVHAQTYTQQGCEWQMPKQGQSASPEGAIRISPLVLHALIDKTPEGQNPNPEIHGLAIVKVVMDETGKVAKTCVLQAPDESSATVAQRLVETWTFKPYYLNRKAVAYDSIIGVRFENKAAKVEKLMPAAANTKNK